MKESMVKFQPLISCLLCRQVLRGKISLSIHRSKKHGIKGEFANPNHAEYRASHKQEMRDRYRRWYHSNRQHAITRQKQVRINLKRTVLSHYGGKCQCCGECNSAFLAIDHVNNDGAAHRRGLLSEQYPDRNPKNKLTGMAFYSWLVRSGFPGGFQVLCHNCNMGRHICGGVCPHHGGVEENRIEFASVSKL